MQFNEKLKELRLKKSISQAELAKAIYVSRSAVAKWENGLGLPSEESLNLLAVFFALSKEELCSDKAIETVIVNKNVTISKSRKLLFLISTVGLAVIIALILALVLIPKRHKSERFTIDGAEYQYTYQLTLWNGKLAETLNVKSENIYIKNGGEIRTDDNGKISFLLIDAYIAETSELYSVEIQNQDEGNLYRYKRTN